MSKQKGLPEGWDAFDQLARKLVGVPKAEAQREAAKDRKRLAKKKKKRRK